MGQIVKKNLLLLPESIQNLVSYLVNTAIVDRVVLFCSRARGTARENSDYDIAVWTRDRQKWSRVAVEIGDQNLSLLPIDLVVYEDLSAEYRQKIDQEGLRFMNNLGIENFRKTLIQLKAYLEKPITEDRDRAGIIQAFEFTFEQSWKAIQKAAPGVGVQVGNPKQAYMLAIQSGWISRDQEAKWIRLLEDRNLTSHTYKEDLAKEILGRIQTDYVNMFEGLLKAISQQNKSV